MATAAHTDLMADLLTLWRSIQAGEAEIATDFLMASHAPEDHVHWLRHQCLRELRGPGLLTRAKSRTQWLVDNIASGLPAAETPEGREELQYQLHQIAEEFDHFKLYADILADITGAPVLMTDLRDLKLESDKNIEDLRITLFAKNERLARLAYDFTEGGGAGIFYAQAALETDDPLLLRIKHAGRIIFDDEVGHGEHGIEGVDLGLTTDEEFAEFRAMVVAIARERMHMRAAMHGSTIADERVAEIVAGKIEPIKPLTD
jgi:hypothetical protein